MHAFLRRAAMVSLAAFTLTALLSGCQSSAKADETNYASAQSIGDFMDGLDEGATGPSRRDTEFQGEPWQDDDERRTLRASCFGNTPLGACTSNTRTRPFNGCTIGTLTFNGSVTYTWANTDGNCVVDADGESVSRKPDWTVSGALGWTFQVKTTGSVGQRVTRNSATTFTFTSDGIRRFATNRNGDVVADFTTRTAQGIGVAGATRDGRVVDGGTLELRNNLTGVTCTLSPEQLTWTANCNCATSGTVSGSCSNGSNYTLSIKSCGTVDVTFGGETTTVTLGRCSAI
jgi:hypothetical protein